MTINTIIIEDEEMIGDIILQCLQLKGGFDPLTLCRRYEDLHDFHLSKAGLYILDHDNKFGISGSEFLAQNKIPKDKIILMSGRDSWNHIPEFQDYKFLQKPFRMEDLYKTIDEMIL